VYLDGWSSNWQDVGWLRGDLVRAWLSAYFHDVPESEAKLRQWVDRFDDILSEE